MHNNLKLLQQLNSGFKRTIKWKKYLAKDPVQTQNQNLNYMLNTSFQGVNRIFVSSLEKKNRKKPARYYLPKIEIKGNNVKINGTNVFDQSVNSDTKHMETFKKIPMVKEITIHLHAY